jgi:predicted transcriptional regulator
MSWVFLTTHGLVLLEIARNPRQTVRQVAGAVGVTERTVQTVIRDLAAAGYVTRHRVGRRNHYEVDRNRPMRHPAAARHDVADLLRALE